MSYKTRTRWGVGICIREDCKNRDISCDHCVRSSYYAKKENNDNEKSTVATGRDRSTE